MLGGQGRCTDCYPGIRLPFQEGSSGSNTRHLTEASCKRRSYRHGLRPRTLQPQRLLALRLTNALEGGETDQLPHNCRTTTRALRRMRQLSSEHKRIGTQGNSVCWANVLMASPMRRRHDTRGRARLRLKHRRAMPVRVSRPAAGVGQFCQPIVNQKTTWDVSRHYRQMRVVPRSSCIQPVSMGRDATAIIGNILVCNTENHGVPGSSPGPATYFALLIP